MDKASEIQVDSVCDSPGGESYWDLMAEILKWHNTLYWDNVFSSECI